MRKNMRKKQGFTLIELLAVIVILAIIALIATPLILGVIERTQKSAYEASLRSVFSATELYIATADFNDIPEEGIPIIDENIRLKNKEFTSGKIVKNEQGKIVLQDVSNGIYCGNGTLDNLVVVKGSCYSTDTTPPIDVTIGFGTITSNSIEIVANALDVESAISGYEFSIDNGSTWTSKQTSNVYTFTNLTNNREYTFKIRSTNNNNLTTESNSLLVSTNDIPLPTYSINTTDWTDSVVVTITYPERQPEYIYEYSLDEGSTWKEVVSPATTKAITFNSNGNIIARISDGTNIVSGTTYEVTNIDKTAPVITVDPAEVNVFVGTTYTDTGVNANDNADGDITGNIAVTGSVDTSTIGTYNLTYNVSDRAGNVTSATRKVNVVGVQLATISTGRLNNRSLVLHNNTYYVYWEGGTTLRYMTFNSLLQTIASGNVTVDASSDSVGSVSISTNTGSVIWTTRKYNHFFGSHLSSGTNFGWHNAGYMDIAMLNGYKILFHTGRTGGGNYARVYNYNTGDELSFVWSDAGWGESWRVFPYSSDTALAFGNRAGKIKITVDSSGNMTYQQNPSEIPGDISSSFSYMNRIQMDENKQFHYMTNGGTYKNSNGNVSLSVDSGTINDYALNIHPRLAVTTTLIDGTKLNYRIIDRTNNQIIVSDTYILSSSYSYLTPIQSIGNNKESIFIIRRSDNSGGYIFKVDLPTVFD